MIAMTQQLHMWLDKRIAQLQSRASWQQANWQSERGAAMAEYGLLLIFIAVAAIAILTAFGGELLELFTGAEEEMNSLPPVPPAD